MKHIFKITAVLAAISAVWIGLLQTSFLPPSYTWLLPIYLVVALGCYGLFMVGVGLMFFPTCPHEALLLQQPSYTGNGQRWASIYESKGRKYNLRPLIWASVLAPFDLGICEINDIVEAKEYLSKKGVDVASD